MSKTVLFAFLISLSLGNKFCFAFEKRGSKNTLGGVQVDDPFQSMSKSTNRGDRKKAEDIMAQLGYGKKSKTQKEDPSVKSKASE